MAVALGAVGGVTEDINLSGGDIVLGNPAAVLGDVRLHWLLQIVGGTPADGTGMTSLGTDTSGSTVVKLVFKLATGSEGSITHTTPGADVASGGYGFRATGAHATTPINAVVVDAFATQASPATLQTVTTTVDNCLIVYCLFAGAAQPSMAVPTLYDRFWLAGSDLGAVYTEVQATAGATTARNVTWSGSSDLYYAVIAIAPAAGLSATLGQPSETGLAQPIARRKTRTVGQPTETGLAQPVTAGSIVSIGQPSETDTAQPIGKLKRKTIGQAAEVDTAAATVLAVGRFPTAVSANGRWIEDQLGDPWPVFGDSNIVIHTVPHATIDEVETGKSVESYLDELVAHGLNAFWCKLVYLASGGVVAQDVDGNDAFTGTPWQSAIDDGYWDNWETIVQMAAARGITMFLFPTWLGIDDTEGDRALMEAASDVQMEAWGAAIGARFAVYPNIIWMNGGDRASPSATSVERWKNIQDGIISAGATQLWGLHGRRSVLHSDYISTNGLTGQVLDLNTMYQNKDEPANDAATAWGEDLGPVIAYEMIYENEDQPRGSGIFVTLPELRSQYWGPFCAGGNGHVFGNKPRWHMDTVAAYAVAGVTYLETWDDPDGDDDRGTNDFTVFTTLVATFRDRIDTLTPDRTDTFLTAGEGTGATRSAARFDGASTSGVLAVAYRPDGGSATLTFDLTEFAPPTVEISKVDPVSGAVTSLGAFATTGSQAVGSLGNNSDGDSDWVLLFEAVAGFVIAVGQASETEAAQPVTAGKTSSVGQPAETGTAQPCTRRKTRTLGQAVEADFSQTISRPGAPLSQPAETDLAQPVVARKTYPVGQATEVAIAQPCARRKVKAVGFATEIDLARGLNPSGLGPALVGGTASVTLGTIGRGSGSVRAGASAAVTISQGTGTGDTT